MARFSGIIGFVQTVKTERGVYMEQVVAERRYRGDLNRHARRVSDGQDVNADITISNEISIVADPYAFQNFQYMRYVVLNNSKWTISNITVQYPRLNLTLGGVYNGPAKT